MTISQFFEMIGSVLFNCRPDTITIYLFDKEGQKISTIIYHTNDYYPILDNLEFDGISSQPYPRSFGLHNVRIRPAAIYSDNKEVYP